MKTHNHDPFNHSYELCPIVHPLEPCQDPSRNTPKSTPNNTGRTGKVRKGELEQRLLNEFLDKFPQVSVGYDGSVLDAEKRDRFEQFLEYALNETRLEAYKKGFTDSNRTFNRSEIPNSSSNSKILNNSTCKDSLQVATDINVPTKPNAMTGVEWEKDWRAFCQKEAKGFDALTDLQIQCIADIFFFEGERFIRTLLTAERARAAEIVLDDEFLVSIGDPIKSTEDIQNNLRSIASRIRKGSLPN